MHTSCIVLLRKLIYGLKKRHHLQSYSLSHYISDFISRLDPWALLALSNKRHQIKDSQRKGFESLWERLCLQPLCCLSSYESAVWTFFYYLLCAWTQRCTALNLIHHNACRFKTTTHNIFVCFFFFFLCFFLPIPAWWCHSLRGFDDFDGLGSRSQKKPTHNRGESCKSEPGNCFLFILCKVHFICIHVGPG